MQLLRRFLFVTHRPVRNEPTRHTRVQILAMDDQEGWLPDEHEVMNERSVCGRDYLLRAHGIFVLSSNYALTMGTDLIKELVYKKKHHSVYETIFPWLPRRRLLLQNTRLTQRLGRDSGNIRRALTSFDPGRKKS